MPYVYALYVMLHTWDKEEIKSSKSGSCMPYMYALYVRLICIPYMYGFTWDKEEIKSSNSGSTCPFPSLPCIPLPPSPWPPPQFLPCPPRSLRCTASGCITVGHSPSPLSAVLCRGWLAKILKSQCPGTFSVYERYREYFSECVPVSRGESGADPRAFSFSFCIALRSVYKAYI